MVEAKKIRRIVEETIRDLEEEYSFSEKEKKDILAGVETGIEKNGDDWFRMNNIFDVIEEKTGWSYDLFAKEGYKAMDNLIYEVGGEFFPDDEKIGSYDGSEKVPGYVSQEDADLWRCNRKTGKWEKGQCH